MYKLINLKKLLLFILLSYPILLISGPFLSDLAVVISCLFFLFNYSKFKINNLVIFLLIFYLVILITNLFSFNIFLSYEKTIPYLRFILFVIVFSYFFDEYKDYQKYFYLCVFIAFTILIFTSGYLYFFDYLIDEIPSRLGLIHRDEKILGSISVRLIPILFLGIYFFSKKYTSFIHKCFYIFLIIGSHFLVIASGERSAILLLILFNFLFFLFIKDSLTKKLFFKSLGLIILIFVFLQIFLGIKNFTRYDIFYDAFQKKSISVLAQAHSDHFYTAYKMFKSKPITGHGSRSFYSKCNDKKYYSGKNSCSTHPHNIYLQLLAENGLASFSLIFGLFIYSLSKLIRLRFFKKIEEEQTPIKLILINILLNFWPIISTGSFFNNYLNCFFYLPLALLSYYQYIKFKT
ncbi:O-antigen ligase family protein [Candidatus Pelagibacter sp.]|nr:O-antigen ligase family protein [Candidatus Pelagibacter sp.]